MKLATLPWLLALALAIPALADEGMWTPDQIPDVAAQMKAMGLQLDPARLADLGDQPLNAVISLGGCTASFVSPDGLVVTNHHCASRAIEYNSTPERNLLKDGFLAKDRADELFAGPGSRVLVTVELRDVTAEVLGSVPKEATGKARFDAIEKRQKELVAACEADPGHRCRVAEFHGGLQHTLVKQLEIRDVRLAYVPPDAVGSYGGEVDNWMWPRHAGDYSFYRAYVGKDGKPADPAAENVPYHPRHFLRVSTAGLREGDFVMVAGYPGGTSRYRMAKEVENALAWRYPTMQRRFEESIALLQSETRDRPDAALKYEGEIDGLANAAKNFRGMIEGFGKSDILSRKREEEARLKAWIQGRAEMKDQYLAAVSALEELVDRDQAHRERDLYYGSAARGSDLASAASRLYRLSKEKEKPDVEREPGYQERDLKRMRESLTRMERTFDPAVDRASWRKDLLDYAAIPPDQHVEAFDRWFAIEGNRLDPAQLDRKLAEMYGATRLGDTAERLRLMDATARDLEASDDPFMQLAVALFPANRALEEEQEGVAGMYQEYRPRYMAALLAFRRSEGKPVYPDANGTLRVTYGDVRGGAARDGLMYLPFTTLAGLLEKETGREPFASPPALLAAIRAGHQGRFRDERLGTVPVDFLSTVDTTGGNSGSPTLNARGELVGLLFDGTYDSINSDWYFEDRTNRSIHVDIRYVLWLMEQVDGAGRLLEEMGVGAPAVAGGSCG